MCLLDVLLLTHAINEEICYWARGGGGGGGGQGSTSQLVTYFFWRPKRKLLASCPNIDTEELPTCLWSG